MFLFTARQLRESEREWVYVREREREREWERKGHIRKVNKKSIEEEIKGKNLKKISSTVEWSSDDLLDSESMRTK